MIFLILMKKWFSCLFSLITPTIIGYTVAPPIRKTRHFQAVRCGAMSRNDRNHFFPSSIHLLDASVQILDDPVVLWYPSETFSNWQNMRKSLRWAANKWHEKIATRSRFFERLGSSQENLKIFGNKDIHF